MLNRDAVPCHIFWADIAQLAPVADRHLSAPEIDRAARLRSAADRARFRLGAALLRHGAARCAGVDVSRVEVRRSCPSCRGAHGRPRLFGAMAGWHASVTHSAALVGVALARSAAVGLDAEVLAPTDFRPLLGSILAPGEAPAATLPAFLSYWTRKESVLKATGHGLTRPMTEVTVSAPGEPARLIDFAGSPARAYLGDLQPGDGYVAAVTVLTTRAVMVTQRHVHALAELDSPAGARVERAS